MKNKMNCLLCYKPLAKNEIDYHLKCVTAIFGLKQMPLIDIDDKKLTSYAKEIVSAKTAITGVQPKLSLWLEESKKNIRFTIVDGKSNYIIKPQSETYTSLPENEDVCQLTETLTEHKYRGSYEKTGKVIKQYSTQTGLDALRYFELVVFSFIT